MCNGLFAFQSAALRILTYGVFASGRSAFGIQQERIFEFDTSQKHLTPVVDRFYILVQFAYYFVVTITVWL